MKKKLLGSLLCAALCLLLCGLAAADTMVSDDGCWRFSVDCNITKVTAFYPTAAAAGQYYRNAELTVPATLKSGGDSYSVHAIDPDFSGAENARKITLSAGVAVVGSEAFRGLNKLAEITLPSSLTDIGSCAFEGCTSLKAVTIPADNLIAIGAQAFKGTDGLTVTFEGSLQQWIDCTGSIIYPLEYATGSKAITSDGASFGWCGGDAASANDLYWTMSDSHLTIDGPGYIYSAGWNPAEVETLTIGEFYIVGVNREQDDFPWLDQMGQLKSIEVHPNNSKLSSLAAGEGLGGVLFSNDLTTLHYCPRAYAGPVRIPDGIQVISPFAFTGCRGVTGLVPQQGSTDFHEADGCLLTSGNCLRLCPPYRDPVVIPTEAESVIPEAFQLVYDTVGALHVLLPDNKNHQIATSFNGFKGSFSVTIQENVMGIPENTFLDCSGLTSVALPGTLEWIDPGAFQGCTGLTSLTLPDELASIEERAFQGCTGLTSLTLPDEMNWIGERAFQGCTGLRTLDIPKIVSFIRENAFEGCTGLTAVYYPGTDAQWALVTDGRSVLPSTAFLYTLDNQTDYVSINMTGLDTVAGDRVTLTDEKGTVRDVTASGNWTFWNFGAKLTITPGTGRRITYAAGVEGEASVTHTWSAPVTLPLDTSGGVPSVHVTFDVQDGQEVYHLFVSEKKLDDMAGQDDPRWSLTYNGNSYRNGDILLVVTNGVSEMREFTLTVYPNMYGCAGAIYKADGSLIKAVSEAGTVTFTVDSDITLSLTWYDRNTRATLTYDGNGSAGSMAAQPAQDAKAVLAKNGFDGLIKEGEHQEYQRFDGWMVNGVMLAPGDTLNYLNADMTAYAQWTPAYRVWLRPNGGDGSNIDLRIPKGSTCVLPVDAFTRAGYAIAGWNTKARGTGDAYDAGTAMEPAKDLTLYAQWAQAWNVTFDPNGGTGSMAELPIARGQSAGLPACAFSRANHVFTGWNTESDGSGTALAAGDSFLPAGDCTLYARWQQEAFDIHSDGSAVARVGTDKVTRAEEGTVISLQLSDTAEPAEGYSFSGDFAVNVGDSLVAYGVKEFTMPGAAVMIRALVVPAVSQAVFTLPAVTAIEANAFEGNTSVTTVDAGSCTSIGEKAFMGCTGLTQIRLPRDCTIDATAFTGCGTVTVFAPAGGDTVDSCKNITNCVFVGSYWGEEDPIE